MQSDDDQRLGRLEKTINDQNIEFFAQVSKIAELEKSHADLMEAHKEIMAKAIALSIKNDKLKVDLEFAYGQMESLKCQVYMLQDVISGMPGDGSDC